MAVIGQINTVVSANTGPLNTGLVKAAGMLQGFGSQVTSLTKSLGPLTAALSAAAGIAGMGFMVKSSMTAIDSLAKTADSVGLTTESLAGLRRSADRSGVASESLDKGLARMQKTISAAAAAGGSKNFEQLGLNLDYIRALAPEDQFFAIADAVAKVEDQTDRSRLAMETFGRDGSGILKIMGRGADAARADIAKAAELGLAPSREDAALVEDANDAIADMRDSFKGVANVVAVTVAPMLKTIAEQVTAFGIMARKSFQYVMPVVKQFWNLTTTAFTSIGSMVSSVFGGIVKTGVNTFAQVRDGAIDFLIGAEFVWQNFADVAAFAWDNVKLGAIGFYEDTKHLFTVKIPTVFSWFGENFRDIMFTSVDYALTVLVNLGKNIRAVWTGVLNFIKGKGFSVDFTPLSDGFVNTVKAMPEIGERELTSIEKTLRENVDRMGGDLADRLGDHMAKRRDELLGGTSGEVKSKLEIDMADFGDTISSKLDDVGGAKAVERGSADAFSAIFAAMRGDGTDKLQKVGEDQLKEGRRQTRLLEKMADRDEDMFVMGSV